MFILVEINEGDQLALPLQYRINHAEEAYWYRLTDMLNKARGHRWTFRNDWDADEWVITEYAF